MAKQQRSIGGVTVEWDDAKHAQLNARDGGFDNAKIPSSANKDDDFKPARIIVNLKMDLGDAKAVILTLNDVHLKVRYQGTKPTLGWWNGKKWIRFKEEAKEIAYDAVNAVADITLPAQWPADPPIGMYP